MDVNERSSRISPSCFDYSFSTFEFHRNKTGFRRFSGIVVVANPRTIKADLDEGAELSRDGIEYT